MTISRLTSLLSQHPEISLLCLETKMPTTAAAAAALGVREEGIIKTCILKTNKNEFVAAILQGTDRINQAALKALLSCKKIRFAFDEEVLEKTGYIPGGVPPIGLGPDITQVFLDSRVLDHERVYGGGGEQEALILIAPNLIQILNNATVASIAEEKETT